MSSKTEPSRPELSTSSWDDPGERGEQLAIVQFPTYYIQRLANHAKFGISRRYVKPYGMSLPEWRLLSVVASSASVRFSDLTTLALMDKGQVSRTLRALQRRNLVSVGAVAEERGQRQRGPGVNPRVAVSITSEGAAIYQQVLPKAQQYQVGLLTPLTQDERRVFLDVLQRLTKALADDNSRPD